MKKKYIILILLTLSLSSYSQSFNFETAAVPSGWVENSGTLTLSTEHYKEGNQSLCWESSGNSILNISFTSFLASSGNSAYMQIYSPSITNDTLIVEFLNSTLVKKKAQFLCNFKGWHEFNRTYQEHSSTLSSTITSVRITLKPSSFSTRKIYFDNVNYNYATDATRIVGSQWLLDKSYFKGNTSLIDLYANPTDIPVTTPTTQEIADLNSLRIMLKRTPIAGSTSALTAAKNYVNALNIIRNSDGSVSGDVINTSADALTTTFMTDISGKLQTLAASALTDASTMTLFRNFLDHILDQGISEGCNFELKSNDYTPSRTIPANLLNILPACTSEQKVEVLKLVRWISYYGMIYYPQNDYLIHLVSDVVYLFLPHMMGVALFQEDDATAIRELKAFKRFLERNSEYVPGDGDILKPDGTGFHHGTNYNNYMYSYKTWVEYLNYLKGTQFHISVDAYQRLKKAVISVYTMATLDTSDSHYFANSLAGRNPFDSGVQLQFTKSLFDNLISIGADCLGAQDEELEAAYNYFFKTTKYNVTPKSYEGFYQFNYSPIGVYRKANWVATMRAPTTKFFGAEIYSGANRFGRYQSHGSLDIMYSGSLAASGYPTNSTGGGWDWNVIPGTTTVHYTSWQEMMPNKTTTDRFDQYSKTKNFSGALSFGDCGIFATDFDQIDIWGSQKFTSTNLTFKKSMFAFDNLVISLGSGISSSGTYDAGMITATNLFQNIISTSSKIFYLNGSIITKPNTTTLTTAQDNWLITPQGTGYFIPQGNDPIEIRCIDQSTPVESGSDYASPKTTSAAAKAYLNHGVKPSSKTYSFVVVPATNNTEMQSLATQLANGGGSIYQILSQNSSVHALLYKPLNITAYSFFGAASNLNYGIVTASSAENLLMDKYDIDMNRHYFAICDPNMHPKTDETYGWISASSQTTLTLAGEWLPLSSVVGVNFSTPSNGQTQVQISMYDGEPIYFGVKTVGDTTAIKAMNEVDWIQFSKNADGIHFHLSEISENELKIKIYSVSGQLIIEKELTNPLGDIDIPVSKIYSGILFCTVTGRVGTKTFKWSN